MTNEHLNWLMVGQFEQKKEKRSIETIRAEVQQIRSTQIGIAPVGEININADSSYHSRGFKR